MVPRLSMSSASAHADAVVADRQRLRRLVGGKLDLELGIVGDEFGLGDRLIAQLVAGIGGIGDEFAQEDVAVGIDRMHHEMQELGDFRLELMGLRFGLRLRFRRLGHRIPHADNDWNVRRRYRCVQACAGSSACAKSKTAGHDGPAANSMTPHSRKGRWVGPAVRKLRGAGGLRFPTPATQPGHRGNDAFIASHRGDSLIGMRRTEQCANCRIDQRGTG